MLLQQFHHPILPAPGNLWHEKLESSLLNSLEFHKQRTMPGGSLNFSGAQVGLPKASEII